jgi:hypothetical protein
VTVLCLTQKRQASSRHPHEPEHVDLPHADPFVVNGLREWIQPERTTCIVDEDVDMSEALCNLFHEVFDAFFIRDIKMNRDAIFARNSREALDATRADNDLIAVSTECDGGRGSDAG